MQMPTFETDQVILRPFTLEDAAGLHQVNSTPEVMEYIGPVESSVEKTRQYLQKGPLADYQKHGFGRHACLDKTSGEIIGFCGIKYVEQLGDVDIGYRFLPQYWGKGLATQTSQIIMDYAKHTLGLKRIIGLALPGNAGSIRVLEKLGLTYEKDIEYMGDVCKLLSWSPLPRG